MRISEVNGSGMKGEELLETIKDYAATRYDLTRLKLVDKSSQLLASLISSVAIIIVMCFFLFFLSYAVAGYLSIAIGSPFSGFLIVGGVYLILGLLLYYLRNRHLELPLSNHFVKEFLKEH